MKATILFTSIAAIVGSILFISKPVNAIGSGSTPKTVKTGSYSTTISFECPVAGKPALVLEPNYEYTVNDGVQTYDHCHECNIGAFLPAKDTNIIRCSYCGVLKPSKS
jgi:hypothetical protein